MMDLVHGAFQRAHHSMIEAGTGVGKSIAYLLPALNRGRSEQKACHHQHLHNAVAGTAAAKGYPPTT